MSVLASSSTKASLTQSMPLSISDQSLVHIANRFCSPGTRDPYNPNEPAAIRLTRQSPYHAAGFRMLVPGIGSSSCECRKPLVRIWRAKSACFFSCCEGLPVPGVTSPIRLPCCSRTRRIASATSLSLLTTTPQS